MPFKTCGIISIYCKYYVGKLTECFAKFFKNIRNLNCFCSLNLPETELNNLFLLKLPLFLFLNILLDL